MAHQNDEIMRLVIIPTYNELGNIGRMIDAVMALPIKMNVLVVEDNSPDGTANLVKEKMAEYTDRVFILQRKGKLGLGTAYVEGFKYGLANGYDIICEMDADFSHDPNDLPRLVAQVESGEAHVAIGSRYCDGISIINWPLSRLLLSYAANVYARTITGLPVFDTTAGFKAIHRSVLEAINVDSLKSNGYAFQIEVHFRAWKAGFKLREVSIIFREREEGVSKMSKHIVREAVFRVWKLKLRSLFGKF
jgi:dolichol-phosphate mannosyltransferase